MDTVIALVRHGQAVNNARSTFGGHTHCPLTELGHRQAEATAARLADDFGDFAPTAVISSDLLRARQTAEAIAGRMDLELELDPRLRERSLGCFDGLSFQDAKERYPEHWARLVARDPAACPPGGELQDDVFARVSAGIDAVCTRWEGSHVVVVSHGLAIFHAFAHICGLGSPAKGLRVFFIAENCSISTFSHHKSRRPAASGQGDRWILHKVNDCTHLRGIE